MVKEITIHESGMIEFNNGYDFNAMRKSSIKSVIVFGPDTFEHNKHLSGYWRVQVQGEGYITLMRETKEEAETLARKLLSILDGEISGHFDSGKWVPD